jgi:hypothetical protein
VSGGCVLLSVADRSGADAREAHCAAGAAADMAIATRSFDLRIQQRRLAGSPDTLRVIQGERVELRWTSDEVATLHLHGYDIEAKVAPGSPATMVFDAQATGRFPVVAHGFGQGATMPQAPPREKTLLYLEVHPK